MEGMRQDRPAAATPPRRNRVDPEGRIVAIPARGAWTGNRGILHRGSDIVRTRAGIAWIICVLEFRGRRLPQWAPGHYTPLFFTDEAVALAAGHRPCALCRRTCFRAFVEAVDPPGALRAPNLDRLLHAQRRAPADDPQRSAWAWPELPDGTFVRRPDGPAVLVGDALVHWAGGTYRRAVRRPRTGRPVVLTPPATLTALMAGYPVQIDPAAGALADRGRPGDGPVAVRIGDSSTRRPGTAHPGNRPGKADR